MKLIAAAAGDDIDRAARGQIGARIERGTADLELLNRFGRDVCRGGADVLIGDVHAINLDASRTPLTSTDRDADELVLVGSKSPPSRTCTPGSSCARSRKLRPLSGRFSIVLAVTTPSIVERDVSTAASALVEVISTICSCAPTCSATARGVTAPTLTLTSLATYLLNPDCWTVTV